MELQKPRNIRRRIISYIKPHITTVLSIPTRRRTAMNIDIIEIMTSLRPVYTVQTTTTIFQQYIRT